MVPIHCFDCDFCEKHGVMERGPGMVWKEHRKCLKHGIMVGASSIICDQSNLKYTFQPPSIEAYRRKRKEQPAMTGAGWEDY